MPMRITGTNSGLDVDAIVKESMKPYQMKIDREVQNRKVLEYQQEQYKQIMKDSSDFYDKYLDRLKSGNLMLTNSYQTQTFSSGDPTKVMAKGFAGSNGGEYKISTTQLANKATHTFKETDLKKDDIISITMNGKTLTPTVSVATTAAGVVDQEATIRNLNEALHKTGIDVSAKYSQFSGGSIILESGKMGQDASFEVKITNTKDNGRLINESVKGKNAQGVITKDGQIYNFNESTNTVWVDKISFDLKAPTGASTSTMLELEHLANLKETDANATVTTNAGITKITSQDEKIVTEKKADGSITTTKKLTNGSITTVTSSDGKTITTTQKDKLDIVLEQVETKEVDGVITKTISAPAPAPAPITYSPVTLTGTTDVKELKDKIVNFVNDYNKLLEGINTKIFEVRDKDYMPLTEEQKKGMSEEQVKAWEKKAQTGLLRKDNDLERIASAMKSAMSSFMSGSGLSLHDIGIDPVKNYKDKNGLFTIDEDKLTKTLEENSGNVKDLFTRPVSGTDKGGVLTQLNSVLNNEFKTSTSSLAKKAGLDGTSTQFNNLIYKNIDKKKKIVYELQRAYSIRESSLYKKYAALEKALESTNAQQSSLAQMLK